VIEQFQAGAVKGTAHSYIGEEAIAVGTCAHLRKDDYVASYHRGHGHCIAKGARTDRMMAELMGRETGYCSGLGGSMHVADLELGILGANGIVGAAMPLSVGAALAIQLRGGDQVVVAFFGDGANNQGIFHESLNLATVWRLPVIFVCENNHYALSTSNRHTTAIESVAARAASYGIPGARNDGNDVLAGHGALGTAVARARAGDGPSLVEAMTWRWGQHSMRANLRDPRSDAEMDDWKTRDPIARLRGLLSEREIVASDDLHAIESAAKQELDSAVAFATDSPEPGEDLLQTAVASRSSPGSGLSVAKATAPSSSRLAAISIASSSPAAATSRSLSRPRSRAIGSRAFQSSISASERGSRRLARMLCWPQRHVIASIRLGPSPARARATAVPSAPCTASTSLPSMRAPGMP
jgi:2-oxoisovalerate dehydrogenase E1 component